LGYFFHETSWVWILTKTWLGYTLGVFSQAHLVTLVTKLRAFHLASQRFPSIGFEGNRLEAIHEDRSVSETETAVWRQAFFVILFGVVMSRYLLDK
jgi:uncharacterized membrane protein YccF (DUF307 family)